MKPDNRRFLWSPGSRIHRRWTGGRGGRRSCFVRGKMPPRSPSARLVHCSLSERSIGSIRLWEPQRFSSPRWGAPGDSFRLLSLDARRLLIGSTDGRVTLYQVPQDTDGQQQRVPGGLPKAAAFSPSSSQWAVFYDHGPKDYGEVCLYGGQREMHCTPHLSKDMKELNALQVPDSGNIFVGTLQDGSLLAYDKTKFFVIGKDSTATNSSSEHGRPEPAHRLLGWARLTDRLGGLGTREDRRERAFIHQLIAVSGQGSRDSGVNGELRIYSIPRIGAPEMKELGRDVTGGESSGEMIESGHCTDLGDPTGLSIASGLPERRWTL